MPSPFPGMDPYIEGQIWEDFHAYLIADMARALIRAVRPRYVVRIEERVYIENEPDDRTANIRPDLTIAQPFANLPSPTGDVAVVSAPVMLTLPIPQPERQRFLTLRDPRNLEIVTVIELLSPGNKRAGSDGQREYLRKRATVLHTSIHLVELDLLRGGEPLPTVEPLPPADYYAFVCRSDDRPHAQVYAWSLRQPLPVIPIPLTGGDANVPLDLQALFAALYDEGGYDYALDYSLPVQPALRDADSTWAQQILSHR